MQEWLPRDHAGYFVSDLVDSLDLRAILETYTEERGYPPYHPLMMTKLLLYGQVCGIRSSQKLELAAQEHVAFRVLCASDEPDFKTITDFCKRHPEAVVAEDDDNPPPPVPKPRAQRNFTDPEGRIMLNSDKAFAQADKAGAWPEWVSADAGYWSEAAVG